MLPTTETKAAGRPRSAEVDRAIVDAALEIMVEDGYNALSMEQVAARAGVGKATIYRRWPNKLALVADALGSLNEDLPPVPDEGDLRMTLVALLRQMWDHNHATSCTVQIMPRMMAYSKSHPELYAVFQERVLEPRRDRVRGVLRAAMADGEIPADTEVDLVLACLVAPVLYVQKAMFDDVAPDHLPERVVDIVLQGVQAR